MAKPLRLPILRDRRRRRCQFSDGNPGSFRRDPSPDQASSYRQATLSLAALTTSIFLTVMTIGLKPEQLEIAQLKREVAKLKAERDKKPRPTSRRNRREVWFCCEAPGG